jgi:hypothetical protein
LCDAPLHKQKSTVGALQLRKNSISHIDASHSRQPLVKGERLVRYEVNAVMQEFGLQAALGKEGCFRFPSWQGLGFACA